MLTFLTPKTPQNFTCETCYFKCSKQSEYDRHIVTRKHKILTNPDKHVCKKTPTNFLCECGKTYKHRQSLSFHKKTCQEEKDELKDKEKSELKDKDLSDKEIIKMLIKENSEFKNMILEVVKTIQPNNNTTNNNNSHNTTNNNFNLQFFLNDTCKDALNLVDFVEGLQVKLKDLEETARIGYSEGVSKIFINGLNELEENMRPIHCSDAKRETLYIKDQDEWIKEDSTKAHITSAIKTIGKKNIQQIFEWQKKYPDYNDPDSKNNDKYLKMLCNAMNGSTDEEQNKNMNKIVKNIAKEVIIDKN
jgi:signal peptidase I